MNLKNEFVLWGERRFLISQKCKRCALSHTYTHLEKENTYSYLCFINAHCFALGKSTNHRIARFCLAENFNHFHTLLDLIFVFIHQKAWGPHRAIIKTLYIFQLLKHNPQGHISIWIYMCEYKWSLNAWLWDDPQWEREQVNICGHMQHTYTCNA